MPRAVSGCELWQQDMLAIDGAQERMRPGSQSLPITAVVANRSWPSHASGTPEVVDKEE